MSFIFYPFIFILGLFIGSFLNCVIYRLEKNQSFVKGRSYCPHCRHNLSWQDLVPILSFLLLKGKCRYCSEKISIQYPLVEISTALLFLMVFNSQFTVFNEFLVFSFQEIISFSYLLACASLLLVIFVFDLKHFIIPDRIIFSLIAIVFLYRIFTFSSFGGFIAPILSAFGASAFFLVMFLISDGKWMGFGDVKLAFFMGLFLGWPNILVGLFFAFAIGAIIGIGLILAEKKTLKSKIPFGPFLIAGVFTAFFWGGGIINWYLNLIT